MRVHGIVLAGGQGSRFGPEIPKQFVRLSGESILGRAIRALTQAGVDNLVIVSHPSWVDETAAAAQEFGAAVPVKVVIGGVSRNESTWNGLRALAAEPEDIVVVHDAVRPLVPVDVVRRSIEPIRHGRADATDTVIPSADTLVIVDGEDVVEIPDRSRFRRGQTPQTFRYRVLRRAYELAARAGDFGATDDCSLVLRYVPGARVLAVEGDEINIKITTRVDMVVADRMLQMQTMSDAGSESTSRSLGDARVLVVGGTSGIGAAIARAACVAGAIVEVDGRSKGLDVRDAGITTERLNAAAARLGGVDHVVCTAGILRVGALADEAPDQVAEIVNTNITGTLHVARAAYPHLRQSRGSFTVFASSSFTHGRASYVAYSASKAAVVNLAQGLAEEWLSDGIRVNAVSPERTATALRQRAFPGESTVGMLSAGEVAAATIALLRGELTGQVLDVRRGEDSTSPQPGPVAAVAPRAQPKRVREAKGRSAPRADRSSTP